MCKQVPIYIKEICPVCYSDICEKTLNKYVGEVKEIEINEGSNSKEFMNEYLYECCRCNTRIWTDEQWIKENAVDDKQVMQAHNDLQQLKEALKCLPVGYRSDKMQEHLRIFELVLQIDSHKALGSLYMLTRAFLRKLKEFNSEDKVSE